MKSLKDVKAELLANPAVRQAYDAQAPEFELARELIAARTKASLTQGDVAARMGTTQSVVARIESGRGIRHPCEQSNVLPMPWERVPWCAWSL